MKVAVIFFATFVPVGILTALNYWQVLHLRQEWAAWLWYTIKWTPAFIISQVLIYWIWSRGYHDFAGGKMWVVQLMWLAASGILALVMTKAFFNEWPSKGSIVGASLWLLGGIIAAAWR